MPQRRYAPGRSSEGRAQWQTRRRSSSGSSRNRGRASSTSIDEFVAPDFVGYDAAEPEPIKGPAGVKANVEKYLAGFSNARVTVEEQIAEGDTRGHALDRPRDRTTASSPESPRRARRSPSRASRSHGSKAARSSRSTRSGTRSGCSSSSALCRCLRRLDRSLAGNWKGPPQRPFSLARRKGLRFRPRISRSFQERHVHLFRPLQPHAVPRMRGIGRGRRAGSAHVRRRPPHRLPAVPATERRGRLRRRLSDYLESPEGRFAQWLAERDRY